MTRFIRLLSIAAAAAAMIVMQSCDESTTTTGGSLIGDRVEIVMDSTYTVTGRSVGYDHVQSRTTMQLIGSIDAEGFGSISSDIVTQYMPVAVIDTAYVKPEYIDSVRMVLGIYADGFTGDSLMPMAVTAYPLVKQLPSPIYSSFDPTGYADLSKPLGSVTFSTSIDGAENVTTDDNDKIYKNVVLNLPVSFGQKLFDTYVNTPGAFLTPSAFAAKFPGIYLTTTFGSGRITRIDNNVIQVFYHKVIPKDVYGTASDSIRNCVGNYMGVTPEIITNNNIDCTLASNLTRRVDNGETIIVAPLGYDVDFTFPARKIIADYKAQAGDLAVINSLSLSIPAEAIPNDYGIAPPPYVLLVKKSKKAEFFDKIQVNDNITSFYAAYNSATRSYDFSSMRDYILSLLQKEEITDDDVEFSICPVLVAFYENTSSSSYSYYYYYSSSSTQKIVAQISPYVSQPVMTRLRLDKAKIKFVFSKQSVIF